MNALKEVVLLPSLFKLETDDYSSWEASITNLYEREEVRIKIAGKFDGLVAFRQVYDEMPPIGWSGSVILDFSGVSSFNPDELACFFGEIAWHPRFESAELSIEGLQCQSLSEL